MGLADLNDTFDEDEWIEWKVSPVSGNISLSTASEDETSLRWIANAISLRYCPIDDNFIVQFHKEEVLALLRRFPLTTGQMRNTAHYAS